MTIKIENDENTLCVVSPGADVHTSQCRRRGDTPLASSVTLTSDDDTVSYSSRQDPSVIVPASCPTPYYSAIFPHVQKNPNGCNVDNVVIETIDSETSLYSFDESDDDFVDDDSTVSTYSASSDESQIKRVRFCDPLVSEVRTRPRTPPESLRNLFYSYEETQRFRQEYRLERKVLARMDADPSSLPSHTYGDILTLNGDNSRSTSKRNSRHRISRVLVLHNDVLETFYDEDVTKSNKTKPLYMKESLSPSNNIPSDDFFDNDSFWTGSITWY